MRKVICLILLIVAGVASMSAQSYTRLTGNIGPYQATMYINNSTYQGYYYYNDRPKSHFTLKCVKRKTKRELGDGPAQESVALKEYTAKGFNSGTFNGTMEFTWSMWQFYYGTFTNSQGKKFNFRFETRLVQ